METKRIVDINTYWAEIIRDTAQFGQIAVAENPEFNRLADCIFRALKDSFIHSATEYGVKRWESMLQIAPSAGDTLEDRKARILTYLNLKLPYTWRVLKQLIEGIVGEGNVEMNLDNDTQTLTINVPFSHLESVKDLTSRVIPMNLDVEYLIDVLPAGYLAAEFLESTGQQYIKTDIPASGDLRILCNYEITLNGCVCGSRIGNEIRKPNDAYYVHFSSSQGITFGYQYIYNFLGSFETNKKSFFKATSDLEIDGKVITKKEKDTFTGIPLFVFSCNMLGSQALPFCGKIFNLTIEEETHKAIFVAALDKQGAPCLFDKISNQPFYNSGTGSFIVGMTLPQARNLRKLPARGGTLTISLPEGYESDSGVAAALETARAKGWTLTVQTHSDSAIMTLDLFDIWVRKTQDENGQYVDSDGTRWYVDWCNCMYTPDGSSERDHGYESYPSVEEACNIWGLTPYVDPNAEELLIEEGIEQ